MASFFTGKERRFGNTYILECCSVEFTYSRMATEQLVRMIKNQDSTSPVDGKQSRSSRRNIIKAREDRDNITLPQLCKKMNPEELRANDLSRIKGASS